MQWASIPRIPLLLLVQAFFGPRTLGADGHHSEQIPVPNGLVAGSSQANHLARALHHRALHDHHHQCSTLVVSQFVDDLKMYTGCVQIQLTSRRAFPFSWEAQSRSVALKMWIRGHHTWHCPYCWLWLAGKRFRYFFNQACKRFGCRCLFWSPFGSYCEEKSKTCICESKAHSEFCQETPVASHNWSIPPTSMKRPRAASAWTSGRYRAGMCTTTLLAITKSELAFRLHAEVITEYLVFLRDNPLQSKRIERAWQLLLRRFERTARKRRWFQVMGFLSIVIAILLELDWKPVTATHWINDLEDSWTFDLSKTFDLVSIVRDIERACMRYLWRATSPHRHRESLAATAPDLTVLRRHLYSLRKRGLLERAAMLQLAACGGLWPEQRRHEAFLQDHANCPSCDTAEVEKEEHRFHCCKGKPRATLTLLTFVSRLTALCLKLQWASQNLSCVPKFCEVLHQALSRMKGQRCHS